MHLADPTTVSLPHLDCSYPLDNPSTLQQFASYAAQQRGGLGIYGWSDRSCSLRSKFDLKDLGDEESRRALEQLSEAGFARLAVTDSQLCEQGVILLPCVRSVNMEKVPGGVAWKGRGYLAEDFKSLIDRVIIPYRMKLWAAISVPSANARLASGELSKISNECSFAHRAATLLGLFVERSPAETMFKIASLQNSEEHYGVQVAVAGPPVRATNGVTTATYVLPPIRQYVDSGGMTMSASLARYHEYWEAKQKFKAELAKMEGCLFEERVFGAHHRVEGTNYISIHLHCSPKQIASLVGLALELKVLLPDERGNARLPFR